MLDVLRGGAQTTVQDRGRHGWRHLGVGCAGALDLYSMQLANLLVGNDPGAAVLEIALSGPVLRLARSARIAITGARIDARSGDTTLAGMRRIALPSGAELQFGACRAGARAYLAVDGGIAVRSVLGSASTDLRGGFGGLQGRALRSGDRLALGMARHAVDLSIALAPWWIDARPDIDFELAPEIHVLAADDDCASPSALYDCDWRVSGSSDRQGLRLEGPSLKLRDTRERVSAPVVPGTIQLPPDGHPIVLLADAQTTGGYPCIGYVAGADLPRLGQCRPGEALRFVPSRAEDARQRLQAQRARLQRIALAIAERDRR